MDTFIVSTISKLPIFTITVLASLQGRCAALPAPSSKPAAHDTTLAFTALGAAVNTSDVRDQLAQLKTRDPYGLVVGRSEADARPLMRNVSTFLAAASGGSIVIMVHEDASESSSGCWVAPPQVRTRVAYRSRLPSSEDEGWIYDVLSDGRVKITGVMEDIATDEVVTSGCTLSRAFAGDDHAHGEDFCEALVLTGYFGGLGTFCLYTIRYTVAITQGQWPGW